MAETEETEVAAESEGMSYWVKQASGLVNAGMLKKAALPVAGGIAANFLENQNAKRATLAVTGGKQMIDSFTDAFAAYKGGDLADFMMDMLNGTLTAYGIASGDSDAVITSATMRLFKDISHEQEEGIDERYQGAMKARAKRIAGLPMFVEIHREGEGHSHGDGDDHDHDHPSIYKDNEEIESGSNLKLTDHEQEKLMEMLEHWKPLRDRMGYADGNIIFGDIPDKKQGKSAAFAIEKFYEKYEAIQKKSEKGNLTRFEMEEFIHNYGFMITELNGKDYEGFNFHGKKGEPGVYSTEWMLTRDKVKNPDEKVKLPEITLFAPTHEDFKERFSCLYYDVKRGKRDFEPMWARDIVAGDQVKIPAERGIPVDGTIAEVNDTKGKKKPSTHIDATQYTGDKSLKVNEGDKIFQMGWNDSADTITITADKSYKTSSGIMFMYGDTKKKDLRADKQLKLKEATKKYMYLMMAGGAAYFFKDAIKNGENGKYFDTKTLLSKDNIRKTFEFFVSAAPCPLAASMLVYKGLENSLRDNKAKDGTDLSVRVMDRNQLVNAKDIDTVVFDLVGTLTEENQKLQEVIKGVGNTKELMALAAKLEAGEPHPVAAAIRQYAAKNNTNNVIEVKKKGKSELDDVHTAHGGICGEAGGKEIYVGNIDYFQTLADKGNPRITHKIVDAFRAKADGFINANKDIPRDATIIWKQTAKAEGDWAVVGFEEHARPTAKNTIDAFIRDGKKVVIATGSREEKARALLKAMNVEVDDKNVILHAGLKPAADPGQDEEHAFSADAPLTKTEVLRRLMDDKKKIMMVGDGTNDTKAMKMAAESGGIAMGMRSAHAGLIQDSVGVMINRIDDSYRIHKLSHELDKKVNENVNISAGWMGFLVAIHLLGDKIKQWFGFEIGTLMKGALHEGSTAIIALKGGVWDAKKLTDFHNSIDLLGAAPDKGKAVVAAR